VKQDGGDNLLPEGVVIDPISGSITPSTGEYVKRLSEFRGLYRDAKALDELLATKGDIATYKVTEFREPSADIFFGTTTMFPGKVGAEYFMTRGHFHERRDRGEIYYTQSGEGILLLQSREGEVRTVAMKPGVCAFIPPDWAHRSINTGRAPLVFVWCCNQDAGHDYGEITTFGMRQLVVETDGKPALVANPKSAS
jgi:glucose-6-phosphate isomerase, archaeal